MRATYLRLQKITRAFFFAWLVLFAMLSRPLDPFTFCLAEAQDPPPSPLAFGTSEVPPLATMNWSNFWKKLNRHTAWDLEYNAGSGWISRKQDLHVIKNYTVLENGTWQPANKSWATTCKITLNFTASFNASYRLTFAVDLDVKNYVHKEGSWNYTIEYQNWTCRFDWSDLKNIPTLIFSHGVKDVDGERWFWFRIRKDNVQAGKNFVLDPTFGHTTAESNWNIIATHMEGSIYLNTAGSGIADNVSIYCRTTGYTYGATYKFKAGLYYSNGTFVTNGGTNEFEWINEVIPAAWRTVNFSDPKPIIQNNTNYVILVQHYKSAGGNVFSIAYKTQTGDGRYDWSGTYCVWDDPASLDTNNYYHSMYCGFTIPVEPPSFSNIAYSENRTTYDCNFSVTITDAEYNVSHAIFSWNASGSWVNRTAYDLGDDSSSENYTREETLSYHAGTVIGFVFYANNSIDLWGASDISILIVVLELTTYYNTTRGLLRLNCSDRANGTVTTHLNATIFNLGALPYNASYTFLNFTWYLNGTSDGGNALTNPYNLTLLEKNYELWVFFGLAAAAPPSPPTPDTNVTTYFYGHGSVQINGTTVSNGTTLQYVNGSILNVAALPLNASYVFLNMTINTMVSRYLNESGHTSNFVRIARVHPSVSGFYASASGASFNVTASANFTIDRITFWVRREGNPSGHFAVRVYNTAGAQHMPTGSELAESDPVDPSTIGTWYNLVTFTFSGTDRIELQPNVWYGFAMVAVNGTWNNSNNIRHYLTTSNLVGWQRHIAYLNGWTGQGVDAPLSFYGVTFSANTTVNPYNFTLLGDTEIYVYFGDAPEDVYNWLPLAILAAGVGLVAFVLMLVAMKRRG